MGAEINNIILMMAFLAVGFPIGFPSYDGKFLYKCTWNIIKLVQKDIIFKYNERTPIACMHYTPMYWICICMHYVLEYTYRSDAVQKRYAYTCSCSRGMHAYYYKCIVLLLWRPNCCIMLYNYYTFLIICIILLLSILRKKNYNKIYNIKHPLTEIQFI